MIYPSRLKMPSFILFHHQKEQVFILFHKKEINEDEYENEYER